MNSRRRAELQRRLTLNVVPRPPADLGERIKNDIPQYLQAHEGPGRRTISTGLRIAASVIVLLGSVITAIVVMSPETGRSLPGTPRSASSAVPALARETADTAADGSTTEIRLQMSDAPAPAAGETTTHIARLEPAVPPPPPPPEARNAAFAPEFDAPQADDQAAAAGGVTGVAATVAEAPAEEPREARRTVAVAEAAPSAAAAAPPSRMETAEAASKAMQRSADERPSAVTSAYAADLALVPPGSLFGVSLDTSAFDRIRSAIESGTPPSPEIVDVEALVNYFAGAPAKPPREGLRLEVEASPAPVVSRGDRAILRVTIDAPRAEAADGSVPPAATNAVIELAVDPKAVASFRPIGDGTALAAEAVIHRSASVTMLYELELKPNLHAQQRVAQVRLVYTSTAGGGKKTSERQVNGRDLARSWPHATSRHRLATLGAVWGETLKGTEGGLDVARRAAELAADSPGNARARELARLASASSKLRSAGP